MLREGVIMDLERNMVYLDKDINKQGFPVSISVAAPSKPLRLAFGSKKGIGKTAAATHLCKKYDGLVFNFADPLYEIMYHIQDTMGMPRHKDRELLRLIGTWGRSKNPDVWANLLKKKVEENPDTDIFVGDLRFPNEHKILKELGFMTVNITRPSLPDDGDTHESETSLQGFDSWDFYIKNDDTLEEFHKNIEELLPYPTLR